MTIFHGTVNTLERFFSYKDGTLRFSPFNTAYGTVHPSNGPSDDINAVTLEVGEDEYFEVQEEIDKTEGRRGRRPGGNFLHYPDAYKAAKGLGVYGSPAEIYIQSPDGFQDVTARRADGTTKVVGRIPRWKSTRLSERIVFYNRPATKPGDS
jgi:hypothetical protein